MNSSNHTPTVEVKLLKDDEWKRIQQNTFTRWVNQHLKNAPGSPRVQNLATDFHDGILLIRLAEVLAHRNLARFNRKPIMRTQKLDNISTVLNFLQKEEHIKIVNIDSSHIADHNLKLILGLIWTLILHYSISQPIPSSTESADDAEHPLPSPRKSGSSSTDQQQSPKQRLLAWIQEKVPHRRVANFTSDWSDGILLGALVDACLGAEAFTEWRQWNDGSNAEHNTHRAMQAAEDGLGVAKLITPEELTNPNVDEKSVMTYLAQFPRAQPLLLGLISGLDHHAIQHVPCRFRVELERTTLRPSMDILDPCANLLLPGTNNGGAGISMVRSVDDEEYGVGGNKAVCPIYNVQFTPTLVGEYQVTVYAQNVAEPLGPRLPIETALVTALPAPELVGLGDEAVQGERRRFNITNVNDASQLDVLFVDPSGREVILDAGSERDEQTVTCCYTPSTPGEHTLSVLYRKCHIPHSPFTLHVHSNESNNGFDAENNNELPPPPPTMPKEEEMLRQQPLRNGTSPTNVTDVDEQPVVVLEQGDELQQMTPPPVDEEEGTTTMVTQVLKTTTCYTITPQNGAGVDHSATDPLIVDMDSLQLRYRTNSESYGSGGLNMVAADVVVQPFCRHEELQYAPLEVSEELEAVAAGPLHHHAFRPLCRERSPERIEAAAMVTVQGHGLEGFVPGQPAQFMADTSQTDSSVPKALFVGVITARGPADEVTIQHVGDGRYNVFYKIQDDEDAIVFVKYGKNNVDGSPFSVRPMQPGGSSSYSSNGTVLHGDGHNYYRM
uniref:Calponin-homology (CH) domain-containing protein n=1 Tax=Globodera rostochiensis TaxID=31243 RepID=A0A914HC18_GLORO